ncbi:MAG: hypothetical protein ACR2HQ_00795 [Ilumatobacteraceae bacterium]
MTNAAHRRYRVAINAETLALAWARQEGAPAGSVVVVDHEISPRGRHGRLWPHQPQRTAVLAMVWRPAIDADRADLVWLAASLGLLAAARSIVSGTDIGLSWPDALVDPHGERLGEVRAEVQLGPGRVTSAVVTARFDVQALGIVDRDAAVAAMVAGLDVGASHLATGVDVVCAVYSEACVLTGRRVVARLLPRGTARGTVRGVDPHGQLELESATGFVERVSVDSLDHLEVRS